MSIQTRENTVDEHRTSDLIDKNELQSAEDQWRGQRVLGVLVGVAQPTKEIIIDIDAEQGHSPQIENAYS